VTKRDLERELNRIIPKSDDGRPVQLLEDEDTGDRFLIYSTESGAKVQLQYDGDDLFMTQPQMAELFGVTRQNINLHLNNIYSEGELDKSATCKESLQVREEGDRKVSRTVSFYNLDAIISVGYRVSSRQGTMIRKWATDKLVQFATKGFVVDVERLKDPDNFDRFQELRIIIRDIRASEANVYKEVRRICALCADYHSLTEQQKNAFFASIQNKLHHAVTGMTGAEIRKQRAIASQPNMGLTTWSGDHPTQRDILTAKNFLGDEEIRDLNRFTGMLLDYFEQEVDLRRLVKMGDAEAKLDTFIRNNERPLLRGRGSVSKADADAHAKRQYAVFNERRRAIAQEKSMNGD
jgi:hypothetical protein